MPASFDPNRGTALVKKPLPDRKSSNQPSFIFRNDFGGVPKSKTATVPRERSEHPQRFALIVCLHSGVIRRIVQFYNYTSLAFVDNSNDRDFSGRRPFCSFQFDDRTGQLEFWQRRIRKRPRSWHCPSEMSLLLCSC